jgi:hypothetical protein
MMVESACAAFKAGAQSSVCIQAKGRTCPPLGLGIRTILRMNYYVEALAMEAGMAAKSGALVGLAESRVAFVARDDVAAAGILLGEDHAGAIYNATGPSAYSGAERAAVTSEVLGKPVDFATIPGEALRGGMAQMGLPTEVVDTVISIEEDFAAGAFDIVTGDVEKLSRRPPKPLRAALAEARRPPDPRKGSWAPPKRGWAARHAVRSPALVTAEDEDIGTQQRIRTRRLFVRQHAAP